MDSLSMYIEFKEKVTRSYDMLNKNDHSVIREATLLVECIIKEIVNGGVDNSTFIKEYVDFGSRSDPYDAILILRAIDNLINRDDYVIEEDKELINNFLSKKNAKKNVCICYKKDVTRILENLKEFSNNFPKFKRAARYVRETSNNSGDEVENTSHEETSTYSLLLRQKMQEKLQEDWISSQNEITGSLKAIQPDIAKILETIMNFTKTIDEKFVLRLVNLLLEFYNLLYTGYGYHKEHAYISNNRDYQNAVENYVEYMETIVDIMTSFGVEEIRSNPGDEFNPHLHEVCNNLSFVRKTAVIKEHLKSGFKYKDNIIQKELIVLE